MTSIRDIARRARVSIGTVDRVLHDRGRVSSETRAKIRRIIQEVRYTPNMYARTLSLARTFRFGVLMPGLSQDSGYWRIPARGIEKARRELEPYRVQVRYFHFDRYSQRSFERAVNLCGRERPDAVLIAPVLPEIAGRLIPSSFRNIPHAFFDSTLPGTTCLATIGQDHRQSGLLAASLMRMVVRSEGTVAVVKILPEDFHINERIRGFREGMTRQPSLTVVEYEADSRNGDAAFLHLVDSILKEHDDLGGMFVSNAWTHAVARALETLGPPNGVHLIGYDLVLKNLHYLEKGIIDFLISQRPETQGYRGIYTLFRNVVLREKVQKEVKVPLDILTRDNLAYYQD
jgi:LacI family transcriptional regulator